jgi:hypothetical protein
MSWFSSFVGGVKQAVKNPATLITAAVYAVSGNWVMAAATIAAAGASVALTPKPDLPSYADYAADAQNRTQMIKQPTHPRRFVYGKTRISGLLAHAESTDSDQKLHLVILVATHEINSFDTIYIDDQAVTLDGSGNVTAPSQFANKVRINTHLGTTGQAADADLVAESGAGWSVDHKLSGIAYIYARLDFDRNAFPNGIPNISAVVEGKKVYDPRTSTTVYSPNPALCIRDYLMNSTYGVGATSAEIDDTAFQSAANICDESVALSGGGTENRYEFHGVMQTNNAPKRILEEMITSCGGIISYVNGKFTMKVAKYVAPTVTLDEDDVIDTINVQTKRSKRDNYNAIKGIFSPEVTNFVAADYPALTSSTFETEDGGDRKFINYNLPYTVSSPMAQRLAKIALYRNRQQISMQLNCNLKAFDISVGDNIYVTNSRLGFNQKVFQVSEWSFSVKSGEQGDPILAVDLALRENNSAVYDWNANEKVFSLDNTTLPSPFNLPAPTLTAADEAQVVNQKITSVLVATPASTSVYANQFEVQAKKTTDTNYISLGVSSSPRFELHNVVANTTYDVRARIISQQGIASPYTTIQHTVGSTPAAISDVTNFSVNVNGQNADLSWTPLTEQSLSHYIVRHSPLTTGATYGNAKTVAAKISRPASTATLPAQTGTYFIKAVDKLGGTSADADSSVVLVSALQGFQNVSSIDEHPDFGGTKTDVIVIDNKLQLDTADLFDDVAGNFDDAVGLFDGGNASVVSTGTYTFEDYIDLGAVFTAQATYTLKVNQLSQITGATTNVGATDVDIFVSTTDDDPAGTPTWSAYRQFIVGSYTARAFRFKAVLSTTQSDETPQIEELTININMANTQQSDNDIQSGTAAGGKVITFPVAFKTLQAVAISVGDMQSGDFYAITSKSATGFTIVFKDSGNTVIDRLFDYVATGV